MKSRIFRKLMASFGAVILLFTVILGSVFLILFRNHTISMNRVAMEQKAAFIAETLGSIQNKKGSGYGAYLRYLDELAMAEVWIVDEDLNINTCGHGKGTLIYEDLPENAEQIVTRVFAGELTYGEEFSGYLGIKSITVGAPIYRDGEIIGAVLLHSPVSGVNEAVTQGLIALILGCIISIVFAGIAAAVCSYRFTHPLYRMRETAAELAKGNYEAQTGVCQEDEIGQLAGTIDTLAEHLKAAKEERENVDRMRESFVANVSHELRTPVAVLRGYIELLQDGAVEDPKEIRGYYAQMLSESRHMERLVNDLLELSRLEDAGFQLAIEEVDLCNVVSDAARAIRRTAMSKEIQVELTVPDHECVIRGDYVRIRQLCIILLDNAVKFSHEKGNIEVALTTDDTDDTYMIQVTDHGEGIPKEQLPYIFERFYKSSSRNNKSGSGLGLAIAGEIVKRHGAQIRVQSDDHATIFTVIFQRELRDSIRDGGWISK